MEQEEMLEELWERLRCLRQGREYPNKGKAGKEREGLPERVLEELWELERDWRELAVFAGELAAGHVGTAAPGRRNYLAGSLKELQSQLLDLTWKARLLGSGRIVGKLPGTGELQEAFNSVIGRISSGTGELGELAGWEKQGNSWRYHELQAALNHMRIMVLEVEETGRVVYANAPAAERLGAVESLDAVGARRDALLEHLGKNSGGVGSYPTLEELYDKGTDSWYKVTTDRIVFPDGRGGYLHMIDDISEWKNHERRLRRWAEEDELTGAYNRKAGLAALEELLEKEADRRHSVGFIDVDNLKTVNDEYGHLEGDYAIRAVAAALRSGVRDSDVVSRYGGDEFLVIFRGCPREAARSGMERMRRRLEEENGREEKPYRITYSYGLAEWEPGSGEKVMDLVERADEEMYRAKIMQKASAGS